MRHTKRDLPHEGIYKILERVAQTGTLFYIFFLIFSKDPSENQGLSAHIKHGQFTKYTESYPYKAQKIFSEGVAPDAHKVCP